MKRLLLGILAVTLTTGAAAPSGFLFLLLKGDPTAPEWCVYRQRADRMRDIQAGDAYDYGQVLRASGRTTVEHTMITPSGDWMLINTYRFAPDGGGSLQREGRNVSSMTTLKADWRWPAGGEPVRGRYEIRDINPPNALREGFYPDDRPVLTSPDQLAFWPLVAEIDATPSAAKLCRKA